VMKLIMMMLVKHQQNMMMKTKTMTLKLTMLGIFFTSPFLPPSCENWGRLGWKLHCYAEWLDLGMGFRSLVSQIRIRRTGLWIWFYGRWWLDGYALELTTNGRIGSCLLYSF